MRGESTEEEKERQTLHVRKNMKGKEEIGGGGRNDDSRRVKGEKRKKE